MAGSVLVRQPADSSARGNQATCRKYRVADVPMAGMQCREVGDLKECEEVVKAARREDKVQGK